ncbi:MAG TPA: glycine cleavage T C-terminal barrel domain-containing protein [Thermoleophilaceae bacterium]|nr:glycine cleavage T C-terminal barrel domain-containing protein [Thermoleophilaceae bacterium]
MIATEEHELLRHGVGLVERADRAVIELSGAEAAEFLQGQVTNDVEALEPGRGCYAALLDHKGKIRTDMRILRLAPDRLLVDAEGGSRAVLNHVFETYSLGRQVDHDDLSGDHTVLSLIGPQARERLDPAPGDGEHDHVLTPYGVAVATDVGVDLICGERQAAAARAELELPEASEGAAECLRIERGRPRLGFELDGAIPEEAGLNDRAVSFTKGCYVGQETVARLHYKGKPNRHLRGLRLSAPAERGEAIVLGDRQVGTIGSACVSPTHGPIALALVRREAAPGQEVLVGESGERAVVTELPFAS